MKNKKTKVKSTPKTKALNKALVSSSAYVRYRYSGKSSSTFWDIVNSLPKDADRQEMYALGCVLQNVEEDVLRTLRNINSKYVRGK